MPKKLALSLVGCSVGDDLEEALQKAVELWRKAFKDYHEALFSEDLDRQFLARCRWSLLRRVVIELGG